MGDISRLTVYNNDSIPCESRVSNLVPKGELSSEMLSTSEGDYSATIKEEVGSEACTICTEICEEETVPLIEMIRLNEHMKGIIKAS